VNQDAIITYITDTFDGLEVVVASGSTFFFYDPERSLFTPSSPSRRRQAMGCSGTWG
jgi:hypothetical protein